MQIHSNRGTKHYTEKEPKGSTNLSLDQHVLLPPQMNTDQHFTNENNKILRCRYN